MKIKYNPEGFSLVEAMISIAIGGIFLASVISTWIFTTQVWKKESVENKLRINIEHAMERIKEDVRLSDSNRLIFYPQGAATYSAVSMPHAIPSSSTGLLTFSSGTILWNQTIIYHVYTVGTKKELRRTLISSFSTSSSTRQTQLNNTVASGTGPSGSTTRTLFSADGGVIEIVPELPNFDGYSSTVSRSESANFGSIRLTPGNHTIRFEVTGKNSASSGFGMGIDSVALTPSGGSQEAEVLPISASSGQVATIEDMSAYFGAWGGNHQINYASQAVGDYITFRTYYDQWIESNFVNVNHSNTVVTGTDPKVTILSREDQSLVPAWEAEAQTQSGVGTDGVPLLVTSVRSVIDGSFMTKPANMVRFKLYASSSASLTINAAYFGLQNGSSPNYSAAPTQLFFDNAPLPVGSSDPIGATNPGVTTSVVIPAGYYVWSNWFEYAIPPAGAPNYLLSMYVLAGAGTLWTDTVSSPTPSNSYQVTGDWANSMADWAVLPGYSTSSSVYATAESASWMGAGIVTSPIYDTKDVTRPNYGEMSWTSTLPPGSSISIKVRSSTNATMSGATDWSLLTGYTISPSDIAPVPNRRYLQFQATLQAASPYATLPELDNVKIDWPPNTAFINISGHYTKKPSYGLFRVLVDGQNLIKALEIKTSASDVYRGNTSDFSLNAQVKPRNTGK